VNAYEAATGSPFEGAQWGSAACNGGTRRVDRLSAGFRTVRFMGEHPARSAGVTLDDVRSLALTLPRTDEALVRDHVKFRVRGIVYASVSPDESLLGFGYPRDERADLVAAEPDKFLMPLKSDERYQWVRARMAALDVAELRELVLDAWQMVVPQKVIREYFASIAVSRPAARDIRST
jgi:hypothetical protein